MRKYCNQCNKITRHKYKYIGKEENTGDDSLGGCLMIILSFGLTLLIHSSSQKLYNKTCSKCGKTVYGVPKSW